MSSYIVRYTEPSWNERNHMCIICAISLKKAKTPPVFLSLLCATNSHIKIPLKKVCSTYIQFSRSCNSFSNQLCAGNYFCLKYHDANSEPALSSEKLLHKLFLSPSTMWTWIYPNSGYILVAVLCVCVCVCEPFPSLCVHTISNCASSIFRFPSWPDPLWSEQVVDQWA